MGGPVVMGRVYGARVCIEWVIDAVCPGVITWTPEVRRSIQSQGMKRRYRPCIMMSKEVLYDGTCQVCPLSTFGGKSIESPDCFPGVPRSVLYQTWIPVKPWRHDGFMNPPITIHPQLHEESYASLIEAQVAVVGVQELSGNPCNVMQADVQRLLNYVICVRLQGIGTVGGGASGSRSSRGGGDVIGQGDNARGGGGIRGGVMSSSNDDGDFDLSWRSGDETQNDEVDVADIDWSWEPRVGSPFSGYCIELTDDLEDLDWSWDGHEPWLSIQVEDINKFLISIDKLNLIEKSVVACVRTTFMSSQHTNEVDHTCCEVEESSRSV